MPITFVNVGTVAAAGSGNITCAMPASLADDDIVIIPCAQHDNVVSTMPAGWTIVDADNNGTGLRSFWAWKRVTAGEGSVVITHASGNAIIGRSCGFRGVRATGDPWDAKSFRNNASSSTVTADAITPLVNDSEILFMGFIQDDGAFSAYSGTNPTFTERIDNLTTLALDASICLAHGVKTDTTTTGNRTATNVRTAVNSGYLVALAPAVVAATLPPQQHIIMDAVHRAYNW